jgi:hypothetical protein
MGIFGGAARVITRTADVTTAAAGAVSGAAINGVIGGVQGTASGIRNGLSTGSHSTAAAALTLGAIGAAGLVEWPLLLGIGGTALAVHLLSQRSDGKRAPARPPQATGAPRKSAPRKATAQRTRTQRTRPRKASTARRRTTARSS